MDKQDLGDALSSSLSSCSTQLAQALKGWAPSPNTKQHKNTKNIQEEILLVIQEIKGLAELAAAVKDGSFDDELKDAKARLKLLHAKRSSSKTLDLTKDA